MIPQHIPGGLTAITPLGPDNLYITAFEKRPKDKATSLHMCLKMFASWTCNISDMRYDQGHTQSAAAEIRRIFCRILN